MVQSSNLTVGSFSKYFIMIYLTALSLAGYIALNGRVISGQDVEGSNHGLI
jgi:hypothetical protein